MKGDVIPTLRGVAASTPVESTVSEGFDPSKRWRPRTWNLSSFLSAFEADPTILVGKVAIFRGTMVRPIILRKDSADGTQVAGDTAVRKVALWELM